MSRSRGGIAAKRVDWRLVLFAAVLIFLAIVAVAWTLARIKLELKQQIAGSLRTVVATTRAGVSLWVDGVEEEISVLAATTEVVAAIQEELRSPSANPDAGTRHLARILQPILDKYEYTGFAILDTGGAWITGSGGLARNTVTGSGTASRAALQGEVSVQLLIDHATNGPISLVAAAPVRDSANRIIAALVLTIDPTAGLTNTVRLARPGATGETYLFDRDARLLTGSRFTGGRDASGPVRIPAPGLAGTRRFRSRSTSARIRDAAWPAGSPGGPEPPITVDVEGYADYRGVAVLGAWTWAGKLDVGIATEVDLREAMAPYRSIRMLTLLMLGAIGASLLALLAVLVNRGRLLARHYAFEQAAEARREALAMVSHDLRAPLNNVLLCSGMISASADPNILEQVKGIIERSGVRMQKLVADLLDVSEIEGGRLKVERRPADPCLLMDDVRDAFAEEAKSRQIQLAVDCPRDIPRILADPDRIAQVLSNLVGNAIKFTPRGGKVSVIAAASAAEVRFEVQDTGPGISEDQLPHVFQQYWTTAKSETAGRGLGLYIAKVLVEHHGGRIWVETGPATGTVFFFTIPLAA